MAKKSKARRSSKRPASHKRSKGRSASHKRSGRRSASHTLFSSRPSKGWAVQFPRRGRERNLLHEQCGSSAFLEPKTLGFPIVPAYRHRRGSSPCQPDCRGLLSAERRAMQTGRHHIAEKAKELAHRYGCSW